MLGSLESAYCIFVLVGARAIFHLPNGHARSWYSWELDCPGKSFVSLWIIILEPNLEFDRLKEVPLLLVLRIIEQICYIRAHSGLKGR